MEVMDNISFILEMLREKDSNLCIKRIHAGKIRFIVHLLVSVAVAIIIRVASDRNM